MVSGPRDPARPACNRMFFRGASSRRSWPCTTPRGRTRTWGSLWGKIYALMGRSFWAATNGLGGPEGQKTSRAGAGIIPEKVATKSLSAASSSRTAPRQRCADKPQRAKPPPPVTIFNKCTGGYPFFAKVRHICAKFDTYSHIVSFENALIFVFVT